MGRLALAIVLGVAGAVVCGGCNSVRELELVSVLPQPCYAGTVDELRINGLGDFPPAAAEVATTADPGSAAADIALPRGTRVITLEGLSLSGLAAFARTAPADLSTVWSSQAGGVRRVPVAYGTPDSFCATAFLAYPRTGHRATLLLDGSVLLSGGVQRDGAAVTLLERYLPAGEAVDGFIATFVPVGDAIDPRAVLGHDATRLTDGRVLISGGAPASASGSGLADGIAYAGAFLLSPAGLVVDGHLLTDGPRAASGGVLLADGRVLLTGGCSELAAGACLAGKLLDSVDIYDPATGVFSPGVPLLAARAGHQALLRDDGTVLIVGGRGEGGVALAPELYDPDEARGVTIAGPTGVATQAPSGLVIALGDAAGSSSHVVEWSGRDEAPSLLPPLPTARAGATLTALEDGAVLIAGGGDGLMLAPAGAVLDADGSSHSVTGFVGRGHAATRLLDGSVLITGGTDAGGAASAHAFVFLRSLVGPYYTPPTLGFDGALTLSPSRPGAATIVDGALEVTAAAPGEQAPSAFAVIAGPSLAGPGGGGFDLSFVAGRRNGGRLVVLFGDPARAAYVMVVIAAGLPAQLAVVSANRPGIVSVDAVAGCTAPSVADSELPDGALAPLSLSFRDGRIEVRAATHTLILSCPGSAAPARGAVAVGVLGTTTGAIVRVDDLQIVR